MVAELEEVISERTDGEDRGVDAVIKLDEWQGCYPSQWKGVIVEDAMAHPAKFSSRLIRRIYEHMVDEGWLCAGDTVLDPFGGVALGALDAMRMGMNWVGVELEPRFVEMGNRNIARWIARFGMMPRWGRAVLLEGDSRKLLDVVSGSRFQVVSSPPYAEAIQTSAKGSGIDYSKSKTGGKGRTAGREAIATGYGSTAGQLGVMKAGGFDSAISSPPFLQSEGGTPEPKEGSAIDDALYKRHAAGNAKANGYGVSSGQLSSMKVKGVPGVVSSPPYEGMEIETPIDRSKQYEAYKRSGGGQSYEQFCRTQDIHSQGYGSTDGQLGADSGDDFWMAAREIVEQVYAGLKEGGHACWVVKDYVKKGQIVPFCDQWRQLCEAVGFVTLHEHHASLVHHKGRQVMLDGSVHVLKTESKSFFRRMAEKKGSPRIDYEVVLCMMK